MPANPYERELRKISDPLKEETRRVRKTLLIWCLATVAMTAGQLFPTKISALGVTISTNSRSVLLGLLAAIVIYHFIAFTVYALADFAHWYTNHMSTEWEDDAANYESYKSELLARTRLSEEDREFMEEHERRLGAIWRSEALNIQTRVERAIPYLSISRALVDFFLPLIAGAVAIFLLITDYRNVL